MTPKNSTARYLLEKDFPGMRIGPEPTTDNFHVIEHAEEEGKIPGNVLSVDSSKPFRHLQQFGGTFLTRWAFTTSTWFVDRSMPPGLKHRTHRLRF